MLISRVIYWQLGCVTKKLNCRIRQYENTNYRLVRSPGASCAHWCTHWLAATGGQRAWAMPMGRGPALGGVCLGKPTDSSETRGRVPMSARQSVHGMPVIAGSIELVARRYRTSAISDLLAPTSVHEPVYSVFLRILFLLGMCIRKQHFDLYMDIHS